MRITRFFVPAITVLFLLQCYTSRASVLPVSVSEIISQSPIQSLDNMEQDILRLVNNHRASIGLAPLQINEFESSVAAQHSRNMASGKTAFGHSGLEKRMKTIARQLGAITETGENVASGQMTAKDVFEGWLKSPGHRKNMEGNFTLTGIGVASNRKGVIYYTQIFTR